MIALPKLDEVAASVEKSAAGVTFPLLVSAEVLVLKETYVLLRGGVTNAPLAGAIPAGTLLALAFMAAAPVDEALAWLAAPRDVDVSCPPLFVAEGVGVAGALFAPAP